MPLLPHFTWPILVRSLMAWGFVRLIVAFGKAAVEDAMELPPTHPLELEPVAALLVVVMVSATGWVYLRRRNEDLLFLCLGYDRGPVLALLALPVLALEVAMGVAVRL
jgi:hypothetical protein